MEKYVVLIGEEHRTALNSLWAVLIQKRFEPDELFLVLDGEKELLGELEEDFELLLENYDADCSVKSSLFSDVQKVKDFIADSEDDENGLIALDISAASKYTTAKVLMDEGSKIFDHIFYLKVDEAEEKTNLLPTIERNQLRLLDLKSEQMEGV